VISAVYISLLTNAVDINVTETDIRISTTSTCIFLSYFLLVSICVQQEEDSLYQQIWLKFEEKTSKMLHLEHGFVWCWNLDASGSRSEISGKFWNVVLEKNGKISWTDHVRNEEVLLRVSEQTNVLMKWENGKLIGLVTSYVETVF